jgi:hypothetical protein
LKWEAERGATYRQRPHANMLGCHLITDLTHETKESRAKVGI